MLMASANISNRAATQFVVVCLCAEWCSSCREYRDTFGRVAREFAAVRFVWIDVEDQAALVDGIDVETFPTLLIGSEAGPTFFGPLAPQPDVLARLVRAHLSDAQGSVLPDPGVAVVLARLRFSKLP